MTQLKATQTTKSKPWKTGAALLMASLGAACGGGGADSVDDGGATHDGSAADGGGAVDSGDPGEGGHAADTGSAADGGTPADSGSAVDSGIVCVAPNKVCAASCTDTNVDPKNCGACGNVCGAAPCVSGSCGGTTSPLGVNLGTAGDYVILAKTKISTVPLSAVTGNLGISPAAATAITGFTLILDPTTKFSRSAQVVGMVYASDYADPTPINLTTAIGDMMTAFTDAAGRAASVTELGAGDIGGMTLAPGVYRWGTGVLIPSNLTLDGSPTSVWIFQIAQGLTVSNDTKVLLAGGAVPKNVFWQVAGSTSIGTSAHFEGVVLDQTQIAVDTGASVNGRLLAQTAVTLQSNTVAQPAP